LLLSGMPPTNAAAEGGDRAARFRHDGRIAAESEPGVVPDAGRSAALAAPSEAPAGFDNLTNGYLEQGPDFESLDEDSVVALRSFNDNRFIFEEVEGADDGLGPTFNAQACRECHQNVVTGGASQIAEHRTGRLNGDVFFESLGGSLIHSRATHPAIVERVAFEDDIRTFRMSTSTLGAGFVEALSNETLLALRRSQPSALRGAAVTVPVLEAGGRARLGRFGWKCQHASLVSFSADAYLNEMGITNPLLPEENTSSGRFVGPGSGYDEVDDPEDDGVDVIAFADFMRSTKVPPRGPVSAAAAAGERVFAALGCPTCHTPALVTAPAGTAINGGEFRVPEALGSKVIHPYSDFLLHDVGTGDGVPVLPTPEYSATARQMRTAPLWGLRTRNRLMHDGLTFTKEEAILRHGGQAAGVTARYRRLASADRKQLMAFLDSL
jgi:CxxC motif-containing protein (DUF1111 family)